ncbi:MAG: hypothetical protein Q8O33_14140 [Pseudomonadota bacterium]|nr:hypothetical protein [Pseudomonadota bacterium]
MDAQTFEDLAAMAEAGRMEVPAQLHLEVDRPHPEAGSQVLLHWRCDGEIGAALTLWLPDGRRRLVPPVGQTQLDVGGEPFIVTLTSDDDRVEVRIEPLVIVPEILIESSGLVLDRPGVISWRTIDAESVRLRLVHGAELREEAVPRQGHVRLTPSALVPVRVEILAASRHEAFSERARVVRVQDVDVLPIVPSIRSWQVGPAVLGEPLRIEWEIADAEMAWIELDGNRRQVASRGSLDFLPDRLGDLEIRLHAHSQHAGLSPLARLETRRTVRVLAPPVAIELQSDAEQWLAPGAEACFHWSVRGAARAWLDAPYRDEHHDLPLIGSVYVPVGLFDEKFYLRGVGHDDQEHLLATFLVHLAIPDISQPLHELASLSTPFDELYELEN